MQAGWQRGQQTVDDSHVMLTATTYSFLSVALEAGLG